MYLTFSLTILFALLVSSTALSPRADCPVNYRLCAPRGVSTRDVPAIGPGLGRLFLELLYTVDSGNPEKKSKNSVDGPSRRETPGLICCTETTECLVLQSFLVPYCWDQFTTDFYLPDGSYGTLANGSYMSAAGDVVNLVSGDYTLQNGTAGNIYQGNPADKPNTSNLPMPSQFTSSGVGTAILASELGGIMTTSMSASDSVPADTPATLTTASLTPTGNPPYGGSFNTTQVTGVTTGTGGTNVPSMTLAYTSTIITPPVSNEVSRWQACQSTVTVTVFLMGLCFAM